MLTSSNSFFYFLKPHFSQSTRCTRGWLGTVRGKCSWISLGDLSSFNTVCSAENEGVVVVWYQNLFAIREFFLIFNFQFIFPQYQDAIWKIFSQGFQNRSYFLKYVVLKNGKLSLKLSTYWWDTLYKDLNWSDNFLFCNLICKKPKAQFYTELCTSALPFFHWTKILKSDGRTSEGKEGPLFLLTPSWLWAYPVREWHPSGNRTRTLARQTQAGAHSFCLETSLREVHAGSGWAPFAAFWGATKYM